MDTPLFRCALIEELRVARVCKCEVAAAMASLKGRKRRRVVLTIEQKLHICRLVESGRTLTLLTYIFRTPTRSPHKYNCTSQ